MPLPDLYGATDGKAVGTRVEALFKEYLQHRFDLQVGNTALLEDKNLPLDAVSRRRLAERLVTEVPEQGVLTISNALQWRLQYSRAISTAVSGTSSPEVVDLRAQ